MAVLPHLLALLLLPLPATALFGNSTVSEFWDDFSNNIASDLAPLISLFGEQVTKQFLSESIHVLDGVVFSIAPLGILTVIISVIRVCGGSLLKSIVGRAREPHGQAEVELCSSTSHDVCELWANGGICRVFGRPRILEFVISSEITSEDLYPVVNNGLRENQPICGIQFPKTIMGALKRHGKEAKDPQESSGFGQWADVTPDYSRWAASYREFMEKFIMKIRQKTFKRTGAQAKDTTITSGLTDDDVESETDDDVEPGIATDKDDEAGFAIYPNLALNIERLPSERVELQLRTACIMGIILQTASFVFTTWVTWFRSSFYDHYNGRQLLPFFVLCILGTLLLQFGMWLSSLLIDFNSRERRFINHQNEKKTLMVWLQPGEQRVGDQEFSAFAYAKQADEYITSWKIVGSRRRVSRVAVWTAISFSSLGWAAQFIGARGLHATVPLCQLGCTVLMSIIRAYIRSSSLKEEKNMLRGKRSVEGCELEWLTHYIITMTPATPETSETSARPLLLERLESLVFGAPTTATDESDSNPLFMKYEKIPHMSIHDALKDSKYQHINLKPEISPINSGDRLYGEIIIKPDGGIVGLEKRNRDEAGGSLFDEACRTVMTTIESIHKDKELSVSEELKKVFCSKSPLNEKQLPNPSSFSMRIRSRLAYLTNESGQVPDQEWSTTVRRTAEQLKLCMQQSADYLFSHPQIITHKKVNDAIFWTAICKHWKPEEKPGDGQLICFSMFREHKNWKIDTNYLEAAISMCYYSIKLGVMAEVPVEHESLRKKRFILDMQSKDDLDQMLQYWLPVIKYERENVSETIEKSNLSMPITLQILRKEQNQEYRVEDSHCKMISMKASSTTMQLIAQDIFTIFMDRMALLIEKILDELTLRPAELVESTHLISSGFRGLMNRHIEALVNIFVSTELGTREEAIMTIMPSLLSRGKLSGVYYLISELVFQANKLKRELKFRESEKMLRGLLDLQLPALSARLIFLLGELYRSESRRIISKGGLSITELEHQQRTYSIAVGEGAAISSAAENDWIKTIYRQAINESFTMAGTTRVVIGSEDARSHKIKPILDDEVFNKMNLDSLEEGGSRLSKALTLNERFNILDASKRTKLQLLRWAIESGYIGLVEDLWAIEEKNGKSDTAFIGGSDEVFWAIAGPKIHPNTIDIVEFLIGVAKVNIGIPLNGENENEWMASREGSRLVSMAWTQSKHKEHMKSQYRKFGSILAAAAAQPGHADTVRLLVEKGRVDINQPLRSGEHGSALAAALYGGSTETFQYLLESHYKIKESTIRHLSREDDKDHLGVHFKVGRFGSLLVAACYWGRADCVELIWDAEKMLRNARRAVPEENWGTTTKDDHNMPHHPKLSHMGSFEYKRSGDGRSVNITLRRNSFDKKDAEMKPPVLRQDLTLPSSVYKGLGLPIDGPRSEADNSSFQDRGRTIFPSWKPKTDFPTNKKSRSRSVSSNTLDPSYRTGRPGQRLGVMDRVTHGEFSTAMKAAHAEFSDKDRKWADATFRHDKARVREILGRWVIEDENERKSELHMD